MKKFLLPLCAISLSLFGEGSETYHQEESGAKESIDSKTPDDEVASSREKQKSSQSEEVVVETGPGAEVNKRPYDPPPVKQQEFVLNVREHEGVVIDEIITTLGENSVLTLGFKKSHLKQLGKKINGVGSLSFLAYIFAQSSLQKQMASIKHSTFKWNGFMDGVVPGLNKASSKDEFREEVIGFANYLGVDSAPLLKKAKEKDWHGFVAYLVEVKNK